jgi:hypothetical protein
MKDSEILEKCADDVSRPGGWTQHTLGDYADPDAPVCLSGALFRHSTRSMVDVGDYFTLFDAPEWTRLMPALEFDLECSATWWNDHPDRTAGEVADAFRTTAKRLREEG